MTKITLTILIVLLISCSGGGGSSRDNRINAVGELDTDFNSVGYVSHDDATGVGSNTDKGYSLVVYNSYIYITGMSMNASNEDMAIWKYDDTGSLVTSFDGDGVLTHHNAGGGGVHDNGNGIAISSGKLLIAGFSRGASINDLALWRYSSAGVLDTTFDSDGIQTHDNAAGGSSSDEGEAVVIDSDGKIIIAGKSVNGSGNNDIAVWRFNSNGTIDTTFNGTGYVVLTNVAGGTVDYANGVAVDSSNNVYVTGISNSELVVFKFDNTGVLDTSFDSDGIVIVSNAGNDLGNDIVVDSSGKVLVAGYVTNSDIDMAVWRFNTDGSLDTTFGTAGVFTHDDAAGGSSNDIAYALTIDHKGRILVTGSSIGVGAQTDMVVWRLTSSGALDTSFATSGVFTHDGAAGGSSNDAGFDIVTDSEGRILVTGESHNGSNLDMTTWRLK